MLIYLAGPIDNVSVQEATHWRLEFQEAMPAHWLTFNPFSAFGGATPEAAPHAVKAVCRINRHAIDQCDALVAKLSGAAFGTVREVEYARIQAQIPVVLILEDSKVGFEYHDLTQTFTVQHAIWEIQRADRYLAP